MLEFSTSRCLGCRGNGNGSLDLAISLTCREADVADTLAEKASFELVK